MSKRKIKPTNQQIKRLQQMEQYRKKHKAEAQLYKIKMKPLINFLKKKQLKFNHASIGQTRIEYFRLDQFQKLLADNKQQIQKNQQLKKLISQIRNQLIYYKRPQHLKSKYPNKLEPLLQSKDNTQKKFASFRFDTTQSKKWLMISLIVIFFLLVLMPIWPYQLKYGLWLVSFVLLIFLSSLIGIRIVIYLFCSIFGYNVWILPNLLGDYGIWGSLTPFLYYQKWENNWFNILVRIFLISSFIAAGSYYYLNPNMFYQNIQFTKQTLEDIHDWGVLKIKNQKNFSQRAITNLDKILNQTADTIFYQQQQNHTTFNQTNIHNNQNNQEI